jgi:cytochrome c-type biogenesis protein CcmE
MAKKGNKKWLIGGTIIAASIITISFASLQENLVYFYTPTEAVAKASDLASQTIKVGGLVKPESVKWIAEQLSLNFVVTDPNGNDIEVKHTGTPPDMFKEGQGVVVEGRIDQAGKVMISKNLMVKHSEEYKKPDDHSTMNKALLEKSMFKQ